MSEPKRYDDVIGMLTDQCRQYAVENARLKAEVERLTSVSEAWKKRRLDKVEAECINWAEVEKENAYLKAIVESHHFDLYLQNTRLKAEVERLTKAGDEMALNLTHIGWNICVEAWNAAKEGKTK